MKALMTVHLPALLPTAGAALLSLSLWTPAHAAPALCDAPQGRVVLRVPSAPGCDLQGLERLPAKEIVTALPPALGMPGEHRWRGVPLRHIVERLGGGEGSPIRLTALNDYTIQIPWSDLVRYDPVLAYQRDGQDIGIRDKGPLILIYPFAAHAPLRQSQEYVNRTIWQVHAVSVR